MRTLTKEESIKILIETVKNNGISGYEIARNTNITESGVNRILNGSTKNPHINTVNAIQNYLEQRLLGSEKNENNTMMVSEPEVVYKTGLSADEQIKLLFKQTDLLEDQIRMHKMKHASEQTKYDDLEKKYLALEKKYEKLKNEKK